MRVHEVFAYLCVHDVAAALDFYSRAFGATEKFRLSEPSGRVGHIELDLGPTVLMLAEPFPEHGVLPPETGRRANLCVHLHVDDADALMAKAVDLGAEVIDELADHFYGERSGRIRCPFGHEWLIGHTIEDVTPEEMQRRYTALFEGGS